MIDAYGKSIDSVRRVTDRFYSGIWGVLGRVFRVPRDPPSLPTRPGESVETIRPAIGYLYKLRVEFAFSMFALVVTTVLGLFGISWAWTPLAFLSFPLALALNIVFAMFGYIAIHLRYDTMWYVISERSIRIRRGIWIIQETTITFENIQNVSVRQGPIQRLFGIANVSVETAGGGTSGETGQSGSSRGLIEGLADPQRIRDLILSRLKQSRSAGLGDDGEPAQANCARPWQPKHLEVLREIRDLAQQAARC